MTTTKDDHGEASEDVLAALSPPEPRLDVAARSHRVARSVFVRRAAATRTDRFLLRAARLYEPIESAAAVCVVIVYLTWTLGTVAALLRG